MSWSFSIAYSFIKRLQRGTAGDHPDCAPPRYSQAREELALNYVGPSLPVGPVNVTPYVRDSFRMQPTEFAPKGMYSMSPGVALSADLPAGGGTLRLGGQVDRTMTNLPTQSNRTNWGGGAEYQREFDTSRIVDAIMRKFK